MFENAGSQSGSHLRMIRQEVMVPKSQQLSEPKLLAIWKNTYSTVNSESQAPTSHSLPMFASEIVHFSYKLHFNTASATIAKTQHSAAQTLQVYLWSTHHDPKEQKKLRPWKGLWLSKDSVNYCKLLYKSKTSWCLDIPWNMSSSWPFRFTHSQGGKVRKIHSSLCFEETHLLYGYGILIILGQRTTKIIHYINYS